MINMNLRIISLLLIFTLLGCSSPKVSLDSNKPTNSDSGYLLTQLRDVSRNIQQTGSFKIKHDLKWDYMLIAAPYLPRCMIQSDAAYCRSHIDNSRL